MTRKKSIMWKYFRPTNNDKATCNLCQHNLSYKTSTTNLKKHIERRHPSLLPTFNNHCLANDDDEDLLRVENTNVEIEETPLDEEENIFIVEYSDDNGNQEKKCITPKSPSSPQKMLRIPQLKRTEPVERTQPLNKRDDLNFKFSNLANSRNELIKIELEAAKKDLELKEWQLFCAKKEEERRQKEHEINMKIKEAELQSILGQQKMIC